ncbi:MAG: sensor histidine kinase [Polaribacter sp.]|nr:sensor histidine kinase [Polaribacter sp.]
MNKAYNELFASKNDSTINKFLGDIGYQYFNLGDTSSFKKTNKEALVLAMKIKDSFSIADTHWNYAIYYNKTEAYDSAYYHFNIAQSYFGTVNQSYNTAKMLTGKAFIKGRFRDYIGSEILIMEAIKKYKISNNYKSLYQSYNSLAIIQKSLGEYEKALSYNEVALNYLKKVKKKGTYYEGSMSNIGIVYHKMEGYEKAISYFKRALNNKSLKVKNTNLYARLLDNMSYSRLLNHDTIGIKNIFYISLQIRDSVNNKAGVVINKLHLAEYYLAINNPTKALILAKEASGLAKKIKNNRDYLNSLLLLSKLDKQNATAYLDKHIKHNDSLRNLERKIRNKFTRIAYETGEYIQETKILAQQKIWIITTGISVLLALSLFYFLRIQKTKNEKLFLELEHQKSNEELYHLTIQQQQKLEEEKKKERNRISEDLHDGVLGKLFGVRLNLGFLNLKGCDKDLEGCKSYIEELQEIEKEIRDISHDLKSNLTVSKIGFIELIRKSIEDQRKISAIDYEFKSSDDISWGQIDEMVKINLYRILQEALLNIIKHAQAKKAVIKFFIKKNELILTIEDNGIGFDPNNYKKGIGLDNIFARIQKIKGEFQFNSEINNGTSIKIAVPL